ncbi:hypothetical protein AAAK29_08490 [Mesorhizobium sp. CCNWLW179-1]|uniref:hypothetical protein n=1 Tax=unclassified Mesorhizobium TaxID=325217 RepID=UPI0030146E2A
MTTDRAARCGKLVSLVRRLLELPHPTGHEHCYNIAGTRYLDAPRHSGLPA